MPPFLIGLAIVGAALYLRGGKKTTVTPTGQIASAAPNAYTTVNPASSGVVGPYTQQGVVQPASLPVLPGGVAMSSAPAPPDVLSDPTASNPGSSHRRNHPPQYQAFNFGPSHDFTKSAPSGAGSGSAGGAGGSACGGCSQKRTCQSGPSVCGQTNTFSDGSNNVMVTSRARQVQNSNPESWLPMTRENIDAYLQS